MRTYELTLVFKPSLKDTERKKLLESVLKDQTVTREEEWGQKPLAYPIKKELAGFYVNYLFETEDLNPSDFEKKLYTSDGVLRHLLTRETSAKPGVKAEKASKVEKKEVKETKAAKAKK